MFLNVRCSAAAVKSLRFATVASRRLCASAMQSESIKKDLFSQKIVQPPGKKVTLVGAGNVGMACALACVTQNVTNKICLIDMDEKKATGEKWDLEHGSCFLNSLKMIASSDYAASADSRICIITAGAKQQAGEPRLALVQRNADLMKKIVPALVEYSPDTILLLICNPVDVMTYVAWRLSGLPTNRVIGCGTSVDTARFHFFIAQRLGVSPASVQGWIIGEHGDSSVAVWSGVSVGCVRLRDIKLNIGLDGDPDKWHEVNTQVVRAGYDVHKLKGYTSTTIGLSCASLVGAILGNTGRINVVTTLVQNQHCIEDEIFLSLPCVLNAGGIASIVRQKLDDHEMQLLHKSAKVLGLAQEQVKF